MNTPSPHLLPAVSASFREVEQLNSIGMGWELDFRQLGKGLLNAQLGRVTTPVLDAVNLYTENAVLQEGCSPQGKRTFAIPKADCPQFLWCKQQITPGQILCFDEENGYESINPGKFHVQALAFSEGLVADVSEKLNMFDFLDNLPKNGSLKSLCPRRLQQFESSLAYHLLIITSLNEPTESNRHQVSEIGRRICEEVVLLASVSTHSGRPVTFRRRAKILKAAVAFIQERNREAISVADVCHAVSATPRTLERAFREHLDITPKSAIKKVRLEGVRHLLKKIGPSSIIREIAGQWGFWHMGDFARDYLNEYGELPSVTISKF